MLNGPYFKTTCNIIPHFLGPMGGLNIKGPLYTVNYLFFSVFHLPVCDNHILYTCYMEFAE